MSERNTSILQPGHEYSDEYDVGAMHSLLLNAFMAGELPRFCRGHALFRPVLAYVSPNPSVSDIADALIEYCQTRMLFPELLSEIRRINPRQYERYQPDFPTEDVAPADEGSSSDISVVFVSCDEDNMDATWTLDADTTSIAGCWWR